MDRLVWPTTKAQLYLVEAAHVKNAVGRERIRRNKDALRELGCLQEILADLHAGEFGREPERRDVVEAGAACWAALEAAAAGRGCALEALCEASQSVQRFLRTSPLARGGGAQWHHHARSSEAATSTRAPSTQTLEADARSIATTDGPSPSEAAAFGESGLQIVVHSRGQRLSRDQLDRLAEGLREQLDQEYTSLLACIEEVQALMEAEVAGAGLLPSRAELEAFVTAARAALAALPPPPTAGAEIADSPKASLQRGAREHKLAINDVGDLSDQALEAGPAPCSPSRPGSQRSTPTATSPKAITPVSAAPSAPDSPTAPAPVTALAAAPAAATTLVSCTSSIALAAPRAESSCGASSGGEALPIAPPARPRWADLSDSEPEERPRTATPNERPCTAAPSGTMSNTGAAGGSRGGVALEEEISSTAAAGARGSGDSVAPQCCNGEAARAQCGSCGKLLDRSCFSRRAWRRVRGLGGAGLGSKSGSTPGPSDLVRGASGSAVVGVACLACTDESPAVPTGPRRQ